MDEKNINKIKQAALSIKENYLSFMNQTRSGLSDLEEYIKPLPKLVDSLLSTQMDIMEIKAIGYADILKALEDPDTADVVDDIAKRSAERLNRRIAEKRKQDMLLSEAIFVLQELQDRVKRMDEVTGVDKLKEKNQKAS